MNAGGTALLVAEDRDERLRVEQRRAFGLMQAALKDGNRKGAFKRALEDLLTACEEYVEDRRGRDLLHRPRREA